MQTRELPVLEPLDDFDFEITYHTVPCTLDALRQRDRVVLVQDESCAFAVTLDHGRQLTLWAPDVHAADHPHQPVTGSLCEAMQQATAWLTQHLVDVGEVSPQFDYLRFPDEPLIAG